MKKEEERMMMVSPPFQDQQLNERARPTLRARLSVSAPLVQEGNKKTKRYLE
jgi:hypothetical protein